MKQLSTLILISAILILNTSCNQKGTGHKPEVIEYSTILKEEGIFLGWPANNGVWIWENGEIMVGFTRGKFDYNATGHNIAPPPHENMLARSLDGGHTWQVINPEGFVWTGRGDTTRIALKYLTEPLDFMNSDFAMRIVGTGYHGSDVPEGGFLYSYDRGNTWEGPFALQGLAEVEELKDKHFTSRTQYFPENSHSALMFFSARDTSGLSGTDRVFLARTIDGGLSFEFISWIADDSDPNYERIPYKRAVMPSAARLSSGKFVVALRRRDFAHHYIETIPGRSPWIDIFASNDNGVTWEFLSRAAETGQEGNGNPPALLKLSDGRLCIAYGNRGHKPSIIARLSSDEGKTWGPEFVLREGSYSDIGYPQMIQNKDGKVVTIYYWTKTETDVNYIEAAIWDPGINWDKPLNISISK